jgi:hypothetical protein
METLPRVAEDTSLFDHSMAAACENQLVERLPEGKTANPVAPHDGRDAAGLNAFCDVAEGLSRTVVVAVTENGK